MKRILFIGCLIGGWLTLAISCRQQDDVEPQTELQFVVPGNFPEPIYRFNENKLSKNGFELGHKLFYEAALSKDNSTSCGTCHQPFASFANLDHAVSHGINDCFGTRNAPPLINLVWQKEFMWDGGVHNIEVSGLNALINPCEMGNTLDNIVATLSRKDPYPQLFKKTFGTGEINSQRLFYALTQFTGMMVSANSRYDHYIRKESGGDFNIDELAGYVLFKSNCSSCHKEPFFTDGKYRSNGLDLNPADRGRDSITNAPTDHGKFRVPTLRNIELTRPYMHDGRFYSLEAVLQHYTSGVKNHINLDPELKKADGLGIKLSETEQKQIILFLKTLTDHEFIQDKRFEEI